MAVGLGPFQLSRVLPFAPWKIGMSDFVMPALGADMEDGTLVQWLVKPGDQVDRGQVVCVVETQKGAVDVEIWMSGVVDRLVAEPGQKIPVAGLLAVVREEGARAGAGSRPGIPEAPAAAPAPPRLAKATPPRPQQTSAPASPSHGTHRVRMSPAARKRAQELGIDPASLTPGRSGAPLTLADVEAAASDAAAQARSATPAPARHTGTPPDRKVAVREAIAAAMTRSNRDIPHYYLGTTFAVETALTWLEAHNAALPVAERALFAALQLRAVALALRDVPGLNGWYVDGAFQAGADIHLGVAVGLRGGGLVAPALRAADRLSLPELTHALRDLLTRARAGQLRSSELSETSITVTNLGDLGVDSVQGVIYPPQVALIGFGRIVERPWVQEGRVIAARTLNVSLAADHRATDGLLGARFLTRLVQHLQEPDTLWLA